MSAMIVLVFSRLSKTEVDVNSQVRSRVCIRAAILPQSASSYHLISTLYCYVFVFIFSFSFFPLINPTSRALLSTVEANFPAQVLARHEAIHESSRIFVGEAVTCIVGYGNFLPGPDDRQRLLVFHSAASLVYRYSLARFIVRTWSDMGNKREEERASLEREE